MSKIVVRPEADHSGWKTRPEQWAKLSVILFLSIQYFFIGILGEAFYTNKVQTAVHFCEFVGGEAEEYKTLNGVHPSTLNLRELDGRPRRGVLFYPEYVRAVDRPPKDEGPYCEFQYFKEGIDEQKIFIIPNKEWVVRVNR